MKRADLRLGGICHGNKGMRPCRKGAGLPFWVRMAGNGCLLLVMLVAGMGMAGCSDEQVDGDNDSEDSTPTELMFSVESEEFLTEGITFSINGGVQTIVFTTNKDWEMGIASAGEDDWCTLSADRGKAGEVQLTVETWLNMEATHIGLLTLKTGNIERGIVVRQEGNGVLNLKVEQAGVLPEFIGKDLKCQIEELKLTGELNGTDFYFIREMAGVLEDGSHSDGILQKLDLSDAKIVSGGNYYFVYHDEKYYTADDEVTGYLLTECENLNEIILPQSIKKIGSFAFAVTSITSLDIPEGITQIEVGAFSDCEYLESITLPNTLQNLGEATFYNCPELKNIVVPDNVDTIKAETFYGCKALDKVTLPEGIVVIERGAFRDCRSLVSINLPNSVTYLGYSAFCNCSSLMSIDIPNTLTYLGDFAFSGCSSLRSIDIPNTLTKLDLWIFRDCISLVSVRIPDSVTSIMNGVFENCRSLTEIELPSSLRIFHPMVFEGCLNLKAIHLKAVSPPHFWVSEGETLNHCTLYIPRGSLETYQNDADWEFYQQVFKEVVEE